MAPNIITVDLTDAPPAQGGGGADHFPRGLYALRVEDVTAKPSNAGKPSVSARFRVAAGPYQGKRTDDNFTFPVKKEDSKFGAQRFHAFLLAFGAQVKQAQIQIDIDLLKGKVIYAEIDDNTIPAKDQYPERVVSKPIAYLTRAEYEEKVKAQALTQAQMSAQSMATAPVPVPVFSPAPVATAPIEMPVSAPVAVPPPVQQVAVEAPPVQMAPPATPAPVETPPVQAPPPAPVPVQTPPATVVSGAAAEVESAINGLFA